MTVLSARLAKASEFAIVKKKKKRIKMRARRCVTVLLKTALTVVTGLLSYLTRIEREDHEAFHINDSNVQAGYWYKTDTSGDRDIGGGRGEEQIKGYSSVEGVQRYAFSNALKPWRAPVKWLVKLPIYRPRSACRIQRVLRIHPHLGYRRKAHIANVPFSRSFVSSQGSALSQSVLAIHAFV